MEALLTVTADHVGSRFEVMPRNTTGAVYFYSERNFQAYTDDVCDDECLSIHRTY